MPTKPATNKKTWAKPGRKAGKSGLTRRQIALQLTELLDLPLDNNNPKRGRDIVRTVLAVIAAALQRGETVTIRGFGTFKVVTRQYKANSLIVKSDLGLRATLDKPYITKPRKKVIFTPADSLMVMLNGENSNADGRRVLNRWKNENRISGED